MASERAAKKRSASNRFHRTAYRRRSSLTRSRGQIETYHVRRNREPREHRGSRLILWDGTTTKQYVSFLVGHLPGRLYADYGAKRKILYANCGYTKLHEAIEKRAIHEMKYGEKIIERILYLEGKPSVGKLNPINIGKDFEAQLKSDYEAEKSAVKGYNDSMRACVEGGDNGTRELFKSNLLDEEDDVDWLEAQMDQIKQMGIQNYLSQQK